MAESSIALHEQGLSPKVVDRHRALVSLMEELEAIDWYAQRAEAASDPELRQILEHNGNEEREHAAMVLEWLRRNDPAFEGHLQTYLFRSGPIKDAESAEQGEPEFAIPDERGASDGSLGIGSLKAK